MPDLDPVSLPRQAVDPNAPAAMARALVGSMFPYLQQPAGPASFQPNPAGKIPEVDPLAGPQPYLQGVVDLAGMAGPELAAKGGALAALHLLPKYKRVGPISGITDVSYRILDDAVKHVGELHGSYVPEGKVFNVDWIGGPRTEEPLDTQIAAGANLHGPANMRSLLRALMKEFPEMESIAGVRISGARGKLNYDPWVEVPVKKPKAE